jgi:hypothetical protein
MPPFVTLRNADRIQHVAVSRLQIYVAGRVHALIYPFQAWLLREVAAAADGEGMTDAGQLAGVVRAAEPRWRAVVEDYTALLARARQQAGDIAYTPWRLKHNHLIRQPIERIQETFTPSLDDYAKLVEMWVKRRNYALQAAQSRVYSDGLNLSQRIWRLEQGGMQTIRNTIATGMAERTNAWDLAERLEGQLAAGQDWPKWSETRLSRMDARQRLASKEGLWRNADEMRRGNPDVTGLLTPPAGISYNALRLARNEIQAANHAVTSDIAQNFPGIVGRKVVLSPAHPKSDICDDVAAGGPYDKSYNALPLHSQCLCRYEEVLMSRADFTKQASAWARGEGDFLDGYSSWLGVRSLFPVGADAAGLLELAATLDLWLGNDVDGMATVLDLGR